ncbi:GLPGLI family protein [Chryseobacterium sp. CH21]|uniref:GLPGLI family protein n=1 Tax=Chryseobacterium sp. CH21 TaxID=713556 RepID=UPI00100BF7F3|nr:GLPGLI family protein [Chryseobacterium sp. CH21]RXM38131.1 GLPGLI family protein [Chryseobacterium sp. CH21]
MKALNFYRFFFLFIISTSLKAQNSSFIYELNYKPNSDSLKTEKIIFYLDVRGKESSFRSHQFRRSDSLRAKQGWGNGFDMEYNNKQLYIYKKEGNREAFKYVFVPLIYNTYAIPIQEEFHWKIIEEKKKIGQYNCQKAEVEYGGRKWIAWFTTEIPLQQGPYIFCGLPGLIVKISDENFDYDFELTQVKDFKWKALYIDTYQKKISWEDFQKLQKNYYTEPLSMINKSDITSHDESGNIIKTNFKQMKETIKKRIRENNNPIELNHKIEYK